MNCPRYCILPIYMQHIVNFLASISPWPTILGPSLSLTLFLGKLYKRRKENLSPNLKRTLSELEALNKLRDLSDTQKDRALTRELNDFIDHLNRSAFNQYIRRHRMSSADMFLYLSLPLLIATTLFFSAWKIASDRATSAPSTYHEIAIASASATIICFFAAVIFMASHYILYFRANKDLKNFEKRFGRYRDEFNSRYLPLEEPADKISKHTNP